MAVKVWSVRDLQSCWECSSTCYTPIQCQTITIAAPTWWHTPTWWPNIAWKSAENQDFWPDLRHETCLHVAVKVWWRDLQSCWECSSTCYTPIQCQTTTIAAPTWWYTPTWWPNIAWKSDRKSRSEAWNLPTCGCKSMVGGTYNHAGSVHQLVIHPYNAKQPLLQHLHDGIPPLDGQTLPESRQKIEIFDLIWGMKPAYMWL